jgi:hypothetical protein
MARKHAAIDHATWGIASAQKDERALASLNKRVTGPLGNRLTLADLPSPDTKRWVVRRKAEVVAAVRGGLLSQEEACRRYALNSDEFLCWQHFIDRFGLAGLRTTRTQFYSERPKNRKCESGSSWFSCPHTLQASGVDWHARFAD